MYIVTSCTVISECILCVTDVRGKAENVILFVVTLFLYSVMGGGGILMSIHITCLYAVTTSLKLKSK